MALLLNTALLFMHNNMATSMDTMPNNCIVLVVVGFLMFQKKKKSTKKRTVCCQWRQALRPAVSKLWLVGQIPFACFYLALGRLLVTLI